MFEAGGVFVGGLNFDSTDQATPSDPITISSYGGGRATVASAGNGITVYNSGGFVIRGLVLTGVGSPFSQANGIQLYTDLPDGAKVEHVRIDDVDVSGYGGWGVSIGGWNGTSAWRDVRVTRADLHNNAKGGLLTYAQAGKANENIYVGQVRAFRNHGNSSTVERSGDGILLGNVDGATVEHSAAFENGSLNGHMTNGPVGIWAYEANNVLFQFNESFDNRTGSVVDGGGFDFDGGVTNSVMQYNYSHGNDGPGLLLYQFDGASPWSNNTVRYNISADDARKNAYGGIFVGDKVIGARVYNNTVAISPGLDADTAAAKTMPGAGVLFANNLFVASDGARVVDDGSGGTAAFRNNAYWSTTLSPQILSGATLFESLDAWRSATGQETNQGQSVGMVADPIFQTEGVGAGYDAFKLDARSPLRDAGLLLDVWTESPPGGRDFFGGNSPDGGRYDIGAHEFQMRSLQFVGTDVGTVSQAGSTVHDAGTSTYLLTGSGLDAESFHFARALVSDAGSLTARVTPGATGTRLGEAGLMVRTSSEPDAAFVSISLSPARRLVVEWRTFEGGPVRSTRVFIRMPASLRLEWSGGVVAASYSNDGRTWRRVRTSEPLEVESLAVAGLYARSRLDGSLATAVFSRVVLQ